MGFKHAQGNQHCAKFESHTNRVTFETNTIKMIVKVHPLDVVFCQIEIVLKDSTAFVYVTKSEKSSHFTLMT